MGTFVLGASRAEPGPFVASIAPGAVLLIDDREGGVESALTSALMATAASGDRAAVLAAMRAAVETHPGCAAVLLDDERNSAFVFGEFSIVAETAGARVQLRATGTSVDELPLPSALTSITIGPADDDHGPVAGDPPSETAFRSNRVHMDLVPTAPTPMTPSPIAEPTGPVDQAVDAVADHVSVDEGAPVQAGPADSATVTPGPVPAHQLAAVAPEAVASVDNAPQVLGVQCPRNHHNHPDAVYCAQCGLRMGVNQTLVARLGPRPPLGVFVLDDGTTMSIESDFVVGREPQFHELVVDGLAQPATVIDPELNLSRAHFAVRLDGWSILANDLGSSNGTYLQRDGQTEWEPLAVDHGVEVGSGDRLRAGSRIFKIQLHHVQG